MVTHRGGRAFAVGGPDQTLLVGRDGCVAWRVDARIDVRIQTADIDGRLVPISVVVGSTSPSPVTGTDLRDIPLGRLASALLGPLGDAIRSDWKSRSAPDLRPERCTSDKVVELMRDAKVEGDDTILLIEIPAAGRKRNDAFYFQVDVVFSIASRISRSPVKDIAEANGVPVTTVQRWLKEARRRRALREPLATDAIEEIVHDSIRTLSEVERLKDEVEERRGGDGSDASHPRRRRPQSR